jgi:hypothetical protein
MAAFTLVAFSFFQLSVGAQSSPRSNEAVVAGQAALVGLARGESLRFSAFNPAKTDSGRNNEPINMQLQLFDAEGNVVAESAVVEIPPGKFRWVDFNYADLAPTGEPGVGRTQFLTQALWGLNPRQPISVSTSLEILDDTSGATFKFFLNVEALP